MAPMRPDAVREEFERFVADSADRLLRTAYLVVQDLPVAEDLVQECLYQVARRWPRVRTMEYPVAYARRILINLALRGAESRQRRRQELSAETHRPMADRPDVAASQALHDIDVNAELISALEQLAPRQRAALVLRYFEDLTEAQVAEAMDCSIGTVKSTTSRALDRLRLMLASTDDRHGSPPCITTSTTRS
jgi:RNA polymerase sigma-70 factor (sigma-E family)